MHNFAVIEVLAETAPEVLCTVLVSLLKKIISVIMGLYQIYHRLVLESVGLPYEERLSGLYTLEPRKLLEISSELGKREE